MAQAAPLAHAPAFTASAEMCISRISIATFFSCSSVMEFCSVRRRRQWIGKRSRTAWQISSKSSFLSTKTRRSLTPRIVTENTEWLHSRSLQKLVSRWMQRRLTPCSLATWRAVLSQRYSAIRPPKSGRGACQCRPSWRGHGLHSSQQRSSGSGPCFGPGLGLPPSTASWHCPANDWACPSSCSVTLQLSPPDRLRSTRQPFRSQPSTLPLFCWFTKR
mmetsp:Transcript_23378/g.53483  ORF Transcript_23378/g.53483 Transcript_23378/m.53483 type:complete len:218 (+) Transcript_23378:184-837(+)